MDIKVGDKIRIRKDFKIEEFDGIERMKRELIGLINKPLEVKEVNGNIVRVKGCLQDLDISMLSPIESIFSHKKIYITGTWNGSDWRCEFINSIGDNVNKCFIDNNYLNKRCREDKEKYKKVVHVITSRTNAIADLAELISDLNEKELVVCVLTEDNGKSFTSDDYKSIWQLIKVLRERGIVVLNSLSELKEYLNL